MTACPYNKCTWDKVCERCRADAGGKPTWDDTFMELCDVIAKRSDDPRTKVGCVIVAKDHTVISLGYNGAPRGVPNYLVTDLDPVEKLLYVVHADVNAIYNAVRNGAGRLEGATMYLPCWPCAECAKGIVQVGITKVVIKSPAVPKRRIQSCQAAASMLGQAGVLVRLVNDDLPAIVVQVE